MADINAARREVKETLREMETSPVYEGLLDYRRLNLSPEAANEVQAFISFWEARMNLLRATDSALDSAASRIEELNFHGYPTLDTREVEGHVYADLEANKRTIDAALERFRAAQVVDMGLTAEVRPRTGA